ncbi:hypothetical protein ARMGADRAFT_1040598 [Armillaria gallica]|uniref:Uncharacterized protein n=1 Tax=Armillaria gallica TaxID=47427 RepID=A0A2H3CC43_ARMGA|nr:hypothetical protein ARMGADRAFT_1040818 [Armillaria gallica]PBK79746.1 hypothetical protein ARMGADRAFT_1040598 [Armillaria gallica]
MTNYPISNNSFKHKHIDEREQEQINRKGKWHITYDKDKQRKDNRCKGTGLVFGPDIETRQIRTRKRGQDIGWHSGDIYSINVNGVEIGTGVGWSNPAVYTVALNPEGNNVFAIAVNIGQVPSLIATIIVDYKDGTSQTIVTDSTWETLQAPPPAGTGIQRPN